MYPGFVPLNEARIVISGAGAAGTAIVRPVDMQRSGTMRDRRRADRRPSL